MSDQLNRVKFTSTTTGTGSSIVATAAYSNAFLTPTEAGAVNGRPYTYVIQQGNDFEIQQDQTWTASGTTIARGTPVFSKISGTAGTSKISMDSTAVIAFGASAADLMFGQTRGADVTAAATTVLDTTTGKTVNLTGTTGISAVTLADGQERWAYYSGAGLTITVGSNLVGNGGGSDITLATGDLVLFKGYASSIVRFTVFRLSGKSVVPPFAPQPQGRLTLSTGVAVVTSDAPGATVVYYTPYIGQSVPLYDGTNFIPTVFAEISQTTTDTTKSPAAVAASSVYDIFVWNDSGTIRATRGPVWTNDTTRSAGTALVKVGGIYLNSVSITNGPAASRGTYVGTIYSNAGGTIDHTFGGVGASGTGAFFGVWNAYNRVPVTALVGDSTDSWTYGIAAWRSANASNSMRVTWVVGLAEDAFSANYYGCATASSGVNAGATGIGYKSTSAFTGTTANFNLSGTMTAPASAKKTPAIGVSYFQALEYASLGTVTFFGDAGVAFFQTGLTFDGRL